MISEETVPKLGLLAVIAQKPLEDNYRGIGVGDCFRIHYLDDRDKDFFKEYCRLFSFEEGEDIRVYSVKDGEHSILLVCDRRNVRAETTGVHFNDVYWISAHTCGTQSHCIFPSTAIKEIKWKS